MSNDEKESPETEKGSSDVARRSRSNALGPSYRPSKLEKVTLE